MILKTKEASKYIGVSINTCFNVYGVRGGRKKKIEVVESNAIK